MASGKLFWSLGSLSLRAAHLSLKDPVVPFIFPSPASVRPLLHQFDALARMLSRHCLGLVTLCSKAEVRGERRRRPNCHPRWMFDWQILVVGNFQLEIWPNRRKSSRLKGLKGDAGGVLGPPTKFLKHNR